MSVDPKLLAEKSKELLEAVSQNMVSDVKALLDKGVNPNVMHQSTLYLSPLAIACANGHNEIVEILLKSNKLNTTFSDPIFLGALSVLPTDRKVAIPILKTLIKFIPNYEKGEYVYEIKKLIENTLKDCEDQRIPDKTLVLTIKTLRQFFDDLASRQHEFLQTQKKLLEARNENISTKESLGKAASKPSPDLNSGLRQPPKYKAP